MKDDPIYDMKSGMKHMGPPLQVHMFRSYPSTSVAVNYTAQFVQLYGPSLTAFEFTRAINNAVWEKAEKENEEARKRKEDN